MNKQLETFLWLLAENSISFALVYFANIDWQFAPLIHVALTMLGKELNKKIKQNNELK